MNLIENNTVAIIFEEDAERIILKIKKTMPIWVIDSFKNRLAVLEARNNNYQLTIFFEKDGESKKDMCSRVLYDVNDHHDCDNYDIYGIEESDLDSDVLIDLNFNSLEKKKYGYKLIK